MDYYGVRDSTLHWIRDFLLNRTQSVFLEGHISDPLDVVSGVPQGTVMGPLLFLAYINDLPEATTSGVKLFADDSLLFRRIRTNKDCDTLQKDLAALEEWEKQWQMGFHPEKCTVIRISGRRQHHQCSYTLHGYTLEVVDSVKFLGVVIPNDLAWTRHIDSTIGKASRTLGFLRRNLGRYTPKVKANAYTALVRPTLECACTVWDSYYITTTRDLKKVQRRAARFTHNCYTDTNPGCVTYLINKLGWEQLHVEHRRMKQRLTMCYRSAIST